MKVLVISSKTPFLWGGAEEQATQLHKYLVAAGHQAQTMFIPFQWEPPARVPTQMLMIRALELENVDRVIALKFPAYLIRHEHKTLWLCHQHRQAYDLFDAGQSNIPATPRGDDLRALIKHADAEAFQESRAIFTNSEVTRARIKRYNGFEAEALIPPISDPELFTGGRSEGYILASGRVNSMKRQHLLVEALAYAPRSTRLVIAGPPDTPEDARRLEELVERMGVGDRVKLDLRFMPRQELADYVNRAAACAIIPYDEDALGYATFEATQAAKPVIAAKDSGGILGLVKHGKNGWVTAAEPRALAGAMAQACAHPAKTRALGLAARQSYQDLGISWPKAIERLLA